MNFYNDNDPCACAWLRELIKAGLIAPGVVDERSICDIKAEELEGFTQCHFFAGIGGWSLALRLAGWPDERPVWTGSCPCQPLSCAGQRKGHADQRHLWPAFHALIAECKPATVFGEQVASADGREWLAGVRADLEGVGYAVGSADLCAASVGAPHRRQRLYWVADAQVAGRGTGRTSQTGSGRKPARGEPDRLRATGGLADTDGGESGDGGIQRGGGFVQQPQDEVAGGVGPAWTPCECCDDFWCFIHECHTGECECPEIDDWECDPYTTGGPVRLGNTASAGREGHRPELPRRGVEQFITEPNFWSAYDLIPCLDGKARRIEPGTFPLAHGVPARVGRLRGYGNAIVPQVAAEFVRASWASLKRET